MYLYLNSGEEEWETKNHEESSSLQTSKGFTPKKRNEVVGEDLAYFLKYVRLIALTRRLLVSVKTTAL